MSLKFKNRRSNASATINSQRQVNIFVKKKKKKKKNGSENFFNRNTMKLYERILLKLIFIGLAIQSIVEVEGIKKIIINLIKKNKTIII